MKDMAVARLNSSPATATILGGTPVTGTKWNQILVHAKRATIGSVVLDTTCFGATKCGGSYVQIEFSADHEATLQVTPYICAINRGTITITDVSDRRVSGTFSGTGLCTTPSNATTPFTVTNGSFDVGVLISGKPLPKA